MRPRALCLVALFIAGGASARAEDGKALFKEDFESYSGAAEGPARSGKKALKITIGKEGTAAITVSATGKIGYQAFAIYRIKFHMKPQGEKLPPVGRNVSFRLLKEDGEPVRWRHGYPVISFPAVLPDKGGWFSATGMQSRCGYGGSGDGDGGSLRRGISPQSGLRLEISVRGKPGTVVWIDDVMVEELPLYPQSAIFPMDENRFFDQLDLSRKGLERVKAAAAKEDWSTAKRELFEYFKSRKTPPRPSYSKRDESDAFKKPRERHLRRDMVRFDYLDTFEGKQGARRGVLGDFHLNSLDVALSFDSVPKCMSIFLDSEKYTPERHFKLLRAAWQAAEFLMKSWRERSNWQWAISRALYKLGDFLPELRRAAIWSQSGWAHENDELWKDFYPDGGQIEMSPHYHEICTIDVARATAYHRARGRLAGGFAEFALGPVADFWVYTATPGFTVPNFGDTSSSHFKIRCRRKRPPRGPGRAAPGLHQASEGRWPGDNRPGWQNVQDIQGGQAGPQQERPGADAG